MNRSLLLAAGMAASIALMALAGSAMASAFVAWEVANVPFGDVLNVRKYPAGYSQKQAAYPNGTLLSMTGRCTGNIDLFELQSDPVWKQKRAVRFAWCEIWHDPAKNGEYVAGWVYGRYIVPAVAPE